MPVESRPPVGERPDDILNSPVGVCQGPDGTVWVADAGNGRVLALSGALDRVEGAVDALELPFRLAHHPTADRLYVSDLGARTVRAVEYAWGDGLSWTNGPAYVPDDGPYGPNGVAVHAYRDGLRVFVADEFYHTGDDLRGRILVFDEEGTQLDAFRTVREAGDETPLYWPQGLATDAEGRLYVADTGYGLLHAEYGVPAYNATVVRCDRTGGEVSFPALADPVLEALVLPRDVAILDGDEPMILVPDAGTGRLHAFADSGLERWATPAAAPRGVGEACARTGPEPALADARVEGWRLRGPVGVAPATTGERRGPGVLVTEALGQAIGAYAVPDDGSHPGLVAQRDDARDGPDQFSFPAAATATTSGWLVADAANARLQRMGPDGGLSPVSVPGSRFPFGLTSWTVEGDRRVAVAEFSVGYAGREEPQLLVYADSGGGRLDPLASGGPWGMGETDLRLPRGLAAAPLDGDGTRLYVADAGNGRVSSWTYANGSLTHHERLAGFGFADGMFWNPADVAVGERGVYVADANNHRIQRYDGTDWHPFGRPGYGAADGRFLLPTGIGAAGGYLVVTDLVNRRIEVLTETADGPVPLAGIGELGGDAVGGDLWMPYMPGVRSTDGGLDVLVPDGSANVCQRYAWTPTPRR